MDQTLSTNLFGTEEEHVRYGVMHEIFGEFTGQLLTEAGIRPGMKVLDLGCGPGLVSLLVGSLVGPSGKVIGLEKSGKLVSIAQQRAAAIGMSQAEFYEADLDEPTLPIKEEGFDAIVERLVFFALKDPAETMRRMARRLKPGGMLVMLELDNRWLKTNYRAWPSAPLVDKLTDLFLRAAEMTNLQLNVAVDLYPTMLQIGLENPQLRYYVRAGGGADFVGYKWHATHTRLFEAMYAQLGLVKPGELAVDTLQERLREELTANHSFMVLPPMIACWARRPL